MQFNKQLLSDCYVLVIMVGVRAMNSPCYHGTHVSLGVERSLLANNNLVELTGQTLTADKVSTVQHP